MNSIVLARRSCRYGAKSLVRPPLYPNPNASRRASLNSAIDRGRRRSQGVGFRGREWPVEKRVEDKTTDARRDGKAVRQTAGPHHWIGRGQVSARQSNRSDGPVGPAARLRRGKKDITETPDRPRLTRAARRNDPNFRFGKKSQPRAREGDGGDEQGRL